jgi:hypothetical protein
METIYNYWKMLYWDLSERLSKDISLLIIGIQAEV